MVLLNFSQKQNPTSACGSHSILPTYLSKHAESALLQRTNCSTVGNAWYPHLPEGILTVKPVLWSDTQKEKNNKKKERKENPLFQINKIIFSLSVVTIIYIILIFKIFSRPWTNASFVQ